VRRPGWSLCSTLFLDHAPAALEQLQQRFGVLFRRAGHGFSRKAAEDCGAFPYPVVTAMNFISSTATSSWLCAPPGLVPLSTCCRWMFLVRTSVMDSSV